MLNKFKYLDVKDTDTPFDSSVNLSENNSRIIAQLNYASALGSLMYVMHSTRLDIAYAVYILLRFTSKPSMVH